MHALLRFVFFAPRNYAPVAAACGASLLLWGAVLLLNAGALAQHAAYGYFVGAFGLWGSAASAIGGGLLVCLSRRAWHAYLFALALLATFVWLWAGLAFLLAMGTLSTAQAMYWSAAGGAGWLALRTAPLRW